MLGRTFLHLQHNILYNIQITPHLPTNCHNWCQCFTSSSAFNKKRKWDQLEPDTGSREKLKKTINSSKNEKSVEQNGSATIRNLSLPRPFDQGESNRPIRSQKQAEYSFDLDELIEFRHHTNQLLGPIRKPTKSGKLRKTKHENPELTKTLEILSGLTENHNATHVDIQDQEFQIMPSKNNYEKVSETKAIQHSTSPESKLNIVDSTLPLQNVKKRKSKVSFRNSEEIVIPKLVPISNSLISQIPRPIGAQEPKKPEKEFSQSGCIEPPSSYDFIFSYPLVPEDESNWSSQSQHFKSDVDMLSLRTLPSVKSILNKTMPDLNRFFLNRWRQKMINELGEEAFKKQQDETIKDGINLHANIMEWLLGKSEQDIQIMPNNEGHWRSIKPVLAGLGEIKALEVEVLHPNLLYRGVFDCIARYKDLLCLIDWKTSKKPRPLLKNTYDDPLQIAAYMGAVNADQKSRSQYGETNYGMIVVGYPDGSPAHVHILDRELCNSYWLQWTDRLYKYYQLTYTDKFGNKCISDKI